MTETVTKDQLKELQKAIRTQYIEQYKDKADVLRNIKSTTKIEGSAPSKELVKLSQLIKSYITKIGIISKPETFKEKNYGAIFKELKGLIDHVFYYFSLLPLFYKDAEYPELLLKKLDHSSFELLNGLEMLCDELDKKFEQSDIDEDRLLCVGMIWSTCDSLEEIGTKGKFGLLADSIKQSNGLVDDVLAELEEFFEDPSLGNGFMLDDGFDSEDEEKEGSINNVEDDKETLEKLEKFLTEWKTKLKLIRLLLSSFASTISSSNYKADNNKGEILDDLEKLHLQITKDIDEFIGDVFMSDSAFDSEDFEEQIDTLMKSVRNITKVMRKLNDKDENKTKWLNVWEAKYFEAKN